MQTTPTNHRNEELHRLLLEATGTEPTWTKDVRANPFGWLRLDAPEKLRDAAAALAGKARLCTVTAYAEERDDPDKRRRIAYHFASGDTVITVTVPIFDPETLKKLPVPSITPWFLNADWNEREFMEMFNIEIVEHPNPKRLFLDERLDAGIMSKLIPFSAMAHGAASNTLWERVLEAKGVPLEERMPSLTVPAEPIKVEPKITPVAATEPKDAAVPPTLAAVAAPAGTVGPQGADAPLQQEAGVPSPQETEAAAAPPREPAAPPAETPGEGESAPAAQSEAEEPAAMETVSAPAADDADAPAVEPKAAPSAAPAAPAAVKSAAPAKAASPKPGKASGKSGKKSAFKKK